MAGPKAAKKKKQQQKHGVDFKKIKRKVGRKLPPPKNATNTEIKSKAIILPEQSVAMEKAGSARSKKGVLLEDLLKQTLHHNSKVRRDALTGIRELIAKYPGELKIHKFALIETLSRRICDDDRLVRETLFQLLKLVIFPNCKENIHGSILSRMMTFIFTAMTHVALEVRLMAFKFLDLVAQNNSTTFLLYAEKILQNYEYILHSNLFNTLDKGKNALSGLVRCLSVLLYNSQGDGSSEKEAVEGEYLHAYWLNNSSNSSDFSLIIVKSKDLLPVLITRLLELLPSLRSTDSLGLQLFDTMLYILQSINLAVKIFITEFHKKEKSCRWQSHIDEFRSRSDVVAWDQTVTPMLLKLLAEFPLYSTDHLSAKHEEKHSLWDAEIAEIFFNFEEWVHLPAAITNKFLPYIETLLIQEASDGRRISTTIREKQLLSFVPYIPKLISQHIPIDWKYPLLQAFTQAFNNCKPESKLKVACVSAIDKMVVPGTEMFLDPSDTVILENQIMWIRELPQLLIALGSKHPESSKTILKLINDFGGRATIHPSLLLEYESLKIPFQAFFSMRDDEGNISYGPFVKLPRYCQELSLACLSKLSCVDLPLLKAISRCCLCNDLDPDVLFCIIEFLGSLENIEVADLLGFFITLLSHVKVVPEKEVTEGTQLKISSPRTLHKSTEMICKRLYAMGNSQDILEFLEGIIVGQLKLELDIQNARAVLQVICELDSEPTSLSGESIAGLSDALPVYLLDVVHKTLADVQEIQRGHGMTADPEALLQKARSYYFRPCHLLFSRSHELVNLILNKMVSLADDSSRIGAILEVIVPMYKNADLRHGLSKSQPEVDSIVQKISHALEENKMTLEETHKVRGTLDRLRGMMS